ncbi:tol-pal system protein YbgF [Candidatus Gillettellia adelgis]
MKSNFRYDVFRLLLLIDSVAAHSVATAQAPISHISYNSLEEQITSLKQISDSQGQFLYQLETQLSENQSDIDTLRGQIQETQHQLSQVVEHQKHIDQQINHLNTSDVHPDSTIDKQKTTNFSSNNSKTLTTVENHVHENSDYNTAISLALEKKQFDHAISAFYSFLKKYPQSTYQPNANYWLGQLFYSQGNTKNAAYYFSVVIKYYAKSSKSPDAMYKIGCIMQERGQPKKAKIIFQQVIKRYPLSKASALAKHRIYLLK